MASLGSIFSTLGNAISSGADYGSQAMGSGQMAQSPQSPLAPLIQALQQQQPIGQGPHSIQNLLQRLFSGGYNQNANYLAQPMGMYGQGLNLGAGPPNMGFYGQNMNLGA